MRQTLRNARTKFSRDAHLPLRLRVTKALRYAREVALAPWYLSGVTEYGQGVRTLGPPNIENFGTIRIGGGTLLRSINVPVELACANGGLLEIGRDCRLNYGVSIGVQKHVKVGDRVRIGPYVMIIDTEFHDAYDREKMPAPRPVIIEDDAWIGAKSSIMPGVTIGRGAIVGVNSVVSADVAPFTVVVGNPARTVRKLDAERFVQR